MAERDLLFSMICENEKAEFDKYALEKQLTTANENLSLIEGRISSDRVKPLEKVFLQILEWTWLRVGRIMWGSLNISGKYSVSPRP